MTKKKSSLFLTFIGFLIFITPIFFFCNNLNKEFGFEQARINEELKQKLIETSYKIEENLDCYNYLKSEINSMHTELFPNTPQEVVEQILDETYAKNLYTKDTFDKLINKIKDKYSPIMIIFGTENFEKIYAYYSPQLEEALDKYKEKDVQINQNKEKLLTAKSFFDMEIVFDKYTYFFNEVLPPEKIISYAKTENVIKKINNGRHKLLDNCYKFISRFCCYRNTTFEPLYTDYFSKQKLYSFIKYTISKNGIHGFYSILIPQSDIDPELIIKNAISIDVADVKISLDNNKKKCEITKTDSGFEYRINYPSNLKNHIEIYKNLRGTDNKTPQSDQQISISIDYPKDFTIFMTMNRISEILAYIAAILYFIIAFIIQKNTHKISFNLTKKLICILSIIMFLPIVGIGILTLLISHNLSDFIDINTSKNLHNSLENYSLINKEIQTRRFASNLELKKIISKSSVQFIDKRTDSLIDCLAPQNTKENKEILKWFRNFNSDFYIFFENGENYSLDADDGKIYLNLSNQDIRKIALLLLKKYIDNLGLLKNNKIEDNELTNKEINMEVFSLSLLENYVNPKFEEKYVPQESIPNKDLITFSRFDSSIFFYAKDINSKNIFINDRINGGNSRPYKILNNYTILNPLWYQPSYRYAYDTELAITFYYNSANNEDIRIQIPHSSIHSRTNDLLHKAFNHQDSGYEKIKNQNQTTFNEYFFSDDSAFIIAGTTKSNHKNTLSLTVNLIFPFIIAYAILLLVLLSNLISSFIKKPIKIYEEALEKLEENHFGTKIESFSNDEFNNITIAFNEMSVAIKQKEQIKRYVSERLIKSVNSNQIQEVGEGKLEKVTILSSDIRNFTGISEQYEPSIIVEMLNSYFTRMQQAISNNNGIIDKYIGDAIQAVFYDEQGKENQVLRAAKAALEMREALKIFNKEREENGLFTIENGIGIDSDSAITGTIGTSEGRKDFSVNGEVIDRAAELEAKTKLTESKILISRKSIEELDCHSTSCLAMTDLKTHQSQQIIFKEFDSKSVELIDVRE